MQWILPLLAAIVLNVEHAKTEEEIQWGLMGRTELEENSGMLFHLPLARHSFWMFNCEMDLDVAFLDERGTILEIHQMRAHPEMMDPRRPVRSLEDFSLYPAGDPVLEYFARNRTHSRNRAAYALEVPMDWFAEHGVESGDRLDLSSIDLRSPVSSLQISR